jgi:hypothetical protein
MVIRVEVGDDYPSHVPAEVESDRPDAFLPGFSGRQIIVAGVDCRPPVPAFDEVRRDEPQRKGNRQLELINALRYPRHRPYRLRAEPKVSRRRSAVRGHPALIARKNSMISRLARSGLS